MPLDRPKIYIVRSGFDGPDCSPSISCVFSNKGDARVFMEDEVNQAYKKEVRLWKNHECKVGIKIECPNEYRREIYIRYHDRFDSGWLKDTVWVIEEHEVVIG